MRLLEILKKNLIIVPILILLFWAIFALLHENFFIVPNGYDFTAFYNAGLKIIQDPSKLYSEVSPAYYYLPAFAYFFAIFTIIPYVQAHLVFFCLNIILGILFILELNKIFKLIGVKHDLYRIMLITIPCLSWNIYYQFYYPQVKFIVGLIMLFIIRREFEWKKMNREKTMSYYLLNYFLLVFSLSISPYYIFYYLILIVDDLGIKNLLKKKALTHFLILIIMFLLQNITLFIFPNLIIEYLDRGINFGGGLHIYYLIELFRSLEVQVNITLVFLIPLVACNLLICFSKYDLPTKLGLSGFCYLIVNAYGSNEVFITISLMLILFVKLIITENNFLDTIKNNKILTIGLLTLIFMNLILSIPKITLYKWIPFLLSFDWLLSIRMIVPVIIIFASILITSINMKIKDIPSNNLSLIK